MSRGKGKEKKKPKMPRVEPKMGLGVEPKGVDNGIQGRKK